MVYNKESYDMILMTRFSKKLKELLREASWTQHELSIRCGISERMINHYTAGHCLPEIDNIMKIAYEFGVSIDELMCFDEYIDDQ